MIEILNGDLLDATDDIIGHQVNCQGKMNSGVAKAIRNKYPKVYEYYVKYYQDHITHDMLGDCQLVKVDENKWVANLFGQLNYGYDGNKYTNTFALRIALIKLREFAKHGNFSVALPYKIGSDRGGADWNEVYKIIDEVFHDYKVTLYKL